MTETINLALIYGSTREGRFCDTVANWAAAQIVADDRFALTVLDPATMQLPSRHERNPGPAVLALRRAIERADCFIVVTPEYNHSYPAALKFTIDLAGREWHAKPVALIAYGGISGGLRAVEHLRGVFAELHAVAIRDTVSFAHARERFDAAGNLLDPEPSQKAMAVVLARLHWWAVALRNARRTAPLP